MEVNPSDTPNDSEAKPKDEPSPLPKSGKLEGKDKGNNGQTADPPGEYPGDDPTNETEYRWICPQCFEDFKELLFGEWHCTLLQTDKTKNTSK